MANIFQQAKQAMELRNKMKKIQKDLESKKAVHHQMAGKIDDTVAAAAEKRLKAEAVDFCSEK